MMTDTLADRLLDLTINKEHSKDIMFDKNFLAETDGRGILEFLYGGCAGAGNDNGIENHTS